eukprot:1305022-Rhodomonas_salina.1
MVLSTLGYGVVCPMERTTNVGASTFRGAESPATAPATKMGLPSVSRFMAFEDIDIVPSPPDMYT